MRIRFPEVILTKVFVHDILCPSKDCLIHYGGRHERAPNFSALLHNKQQIFVLKDFIICDALRDLVPFVKF